ncbi:kelch-like protein 20 [Eupeodes corollae]|uniref:kelch-like protein 20 n=1 Tax=Eupeodes corollae TaxID=290404 RepID=UPI00249249FC|nr:kelch-like protein 20 [Eupeodes corollae]
MVIDNKLFAIGGELKNNITTPSIEFLDLLNFQWSELPPMKRKRGFCQGVSLKGDWCVFGGWDVRQFVNFIEIYNSSTREWYDVIPPSQPNLTSKIAAYNGVLYIIDFLSRSLQCYDVSLKKWTSIRIQRDSLCNFGFVAVEGFVYVIGGEKQGVLQNVVKRYNLSTRGWSFSCSHMKTVCFDGKIVICTKPLQMSLLNNRQNKVNDRFIVKWRQLPNRHWILIVRKVKVKPQIWEISSPYDDIRRVLHEAQYNARIARRKRMISPVNQKRRLEYTSAEKFNLTGSFTIQHDNDPKHTAHDVLM